MLICHKYRLIYIYIPKNACTTLKHLFYELENGQKFISKSPQDIHHHKIFEIINHQDFNNYLNYFKFIFLRNPYDRFLSFYKNKIKNLKNPNFFRNFSKYGFHENMTQKETIELIRQIPDKYCEQHFKPQYRFFKPKMNFIGKVENLENDWRKISLIQGLPEVTINHYNQTTSDILDENIKDLIYEKYRKDFLLGNYQK